MLMPGQWCPRRQSATGLTLIELMIAMAISVLLIGGMLHLFASTQQVYRLHESVSRVQESGRFALEYIARDVRQAGFKGGCPPDVLVNNLLNQGSAEYDPQLVDLNASGVMGWDNASGPYGPDMNGYVAGTDVLFVKHAAAVSGIRANGSTAALATEINLTGPSSVPEHAIVVITDGSNCEMFQNRVSAGQPRLSRAAGGGAPGNVSPAHTPFSKQFGDDIQVLLLRSVVYYVGESEDNPDTFSLRRLRFDHGVVPQVDPVPGDERPWDEEIVEGVIDMQIRYGVDTDRNGSLDAYVAAGNVTDWETVVAVRINLLVRGDQPNVMPQPASLVMAGENPAEFNAPPGDRRMYQVFTKTMSVRNHLP